MFVFDNTAKHLQFIDESHGYGFLLTGRVGRIPCVGLVSYGLSEGTLKLLERALKEDMVRKDKVEGFEGADTYVFTDKNQLRDKAAMVLTQEGFSGDALDKRAVFTRTLPESLLLPLDKPKRLLDEVHDHFRSKVESVFQCADMPADIVGFTAVHTNKADIPFFIVRSRLEERKKCKSKDKKKKLREWFNRLLPETTPVKLFLEDLLVTMSFYPREGFLNEVLKETPLFPPDRIDGYHLVEFTFPHEIDKATASVVRAKLLEVGAAVTCMHEDNRLLVEVPCSYGLGGTVGRAFEARLAYVVDFLADQVTEPNVDLVEKRALRESFEFRRKTGTLQEDPPGMPAFFRKLTVVSEKRMPVLFANREASELHYICEEGNFLTVRNKDGMIEVYHGVVEGHAPCDTILDYYPSLVQAGNGRK